MKAVIEIQNLKCSGCEHMILSRLGTLDYLQNVEIDIDKSLISFSYFNFEDPDRVKKELAKMGYPSVDDRNSFGKKATSYVSCAIGRMSKNKR